VGGGCAAAMVCVGVVSWGSGGGSEVRSVGWKDKGRCVEGMLVGKRQWRERVWREERVSCGGGGAAALEGGPGVSIRLRKRF